MKYLIILSLFLFSCDQNKKVNKEIAKPKPLTELQTKAVQSMNIREQAYMEECLNICYENGCFYSFNACLSKMNEAIGNIQKQPQKENNTILKSAAGAAIGYGVGKVIFGK